MRISSWSTIWLKRPNTLQGIRTGKWEHKLFPPLLPALTDTRQRDLFLCGSKTQSKTQMFCVEASNAAGLGGSCSTAYRCMH